MNEKSKFIKTNKRLFIMVSIFSILTIFTVIMYISGSYALFTKSIKDTNKVVTINTASTVPAEIATDKLIKTLGKPGGLIGVTNTSVPTNTESADIREYRYSGLNVNNYVYFNCEANATKEDASSKCELWRIVGIFKDESGNKHLKIVRNNVLLTEMFPESYTVNGVPSQIKGIFPNDVNWNSNESNDWATSTLQNWLNTENDGQGNNGYLSYLSAGRNMIEENMKYYLGNLSAETSSIDSGTHTEFLVNETAKTAYTHERAISGCPSSGKGPVENTTLEAIEGNTTCRVRANYSATFDGAVGLLYASDFGLSSSSNNWDKRMDDTVINESWLTKLGDSIQHSSEWLISPLSDSNTSAVYKSDTGIGSSIVNFGYLSPIHPTVYLKSAVKITSGNGTESDPYFLSLA